MKASIVILEQNFEVEYDFKITTGGCPSNGWDEPDWPAEFDLEVHTISLASKEPSDPLDFPEWLKKLVLEHLYERDDIHTVVQEADQDSGFEGYDDEGRTL